VQAVKATPSTNALEILLTILYLDAAGDLLVYITCSEALLVRSMTICRRDPSGRYNEIYSMFDAGFTGRTNGQWVAVEKMNEAYTLGMVMLRVENDTVIQHSLSKNNTYTEMSLLPNNVFVGFNFQAKNMDIYKFVSNWTLVSWVPIIEDVFQRGFITSRDQHFVFTENGTHLHIYKYQPTNTNFMLVEVFKCNSTYTWTAIYNGIDTVVVSESFRLMSQIVDVGDYGNEF
jgi:hypothetical protein